MHLLADINPHEFNALVILHVFAAFALVGTVFYACAGAPETRKKTLMWSGIASLLMLATGGRMWMVLKPALQLQGQGWLVVKLFCWLGISMFAGFAYRRREKACLWIVLTLALALTAVAMVRVRPF